MDDVSLYLEHYLEIKSKTLAFYVPKILSDNKLYTEKTVYIDRVSVLISEYQKLTLKFNREVVNCNNFFNLLLLVRDYVPKADKLLSKIKYTDTVNISYENIIEKISKNENLTKKETEIIEFLLKNDLIFDKDKKDIYDYFIKRILLKDRNISFEGFKKIFVDWIKNIYFYKNLNIKAVKYHLHSAKHRAFAKNTFLVENELYELYYSGCYNVILNTFHQLIHVNFSEEIMDNIHFDLMLKDDALVNKVVGYYEDNYLNLSYEIYAEIKAIEKLVELFNEFDIRFKNNQNPYLERINALTKKIDNKERIVLGKKIDIDKAYDIIMQKKIHEKTSEASNAKGAK